MKLLPLIAILVAAGSRFGFESVTPNGEDVTNFHHQFITNEALMNLAEEGEPWSEEAARCLRWHVDWVDSYSYDPRWWASGAFSGGTDRWKASMIMKDFLTAVHFDDLTSTLQIEQVWSRYLSGTMAGLVWAQGRNDVACAQNLVGVSLHALQDFYSHSTWVDDKNRRDKSWVDVSPAARGRLYLYTGSYEQPDHLAQRPHGQIAPACSVMTSGPVAAALKVLCDPLSPLSESSMCEAYRRCQDAVPVRPVVMGVRVPDGLVYHDPPGIALDSTWQAGIGHQMRELADRDQVSPLELFGHARRLAVKHSTWWLQQLGIWMRRSPDAAAFWRRVCTEDHWERRTQPFEDVNRMPVSFAGAGVYPPVTGSSEGWFLRLSITTGDVELGGTDAFPYATVNGISHKLDHLGDAGFLIDWDDFDRGSATAFTLGPFPERPTSLSLRVVGRDVGDVLKDVVDLVKDMVDTLLEAILDAIGSLFGVDANVVAGNQVVWTPAQLMAITGPQRWERVIDGGRRGEYTVAGTIACTDRSTSNLFHAQNDTYQVAITEIICHRESTELSDSEEPFVVAALVNASNTDPLHRTVAWRSSPLSDVDARKEPYPLQGKPLPPVTVPRSVGAIVLPLTVWESDQESYQRRDAIRDIFAAKATEKTQSTADRLIENFGALTGAAWRVGNVEAFAYTRSAVGGQAGWLARTSINQWIEKGQSRTIQLYPKPTLTTWSLPTEQWPATAPGIPLPFQADNDGTVDQSWWSPEQQTWTIRRSDGAPPATIVLTDGALPLPVDLDGDGAAAPAQWLRAQGQVVVPTPEGDRIIDVFTAAPSDVLAVSAGIGLLALHQSQVDRPAGFEQSAARVGLHSLLSGRDPAYLDAEAAVLLEHANYGLYVSTPEAVDAAVRGTQIYTDLFTSDPDRWRAVLADGLRIRTWAHWQADDHPATLDAARRRVALWDEEAEPGEHAELLADALLFAAVFERHIEPESALTTTDRAADLFTHLAAPHPEMFLGRLADTYAERAWALWLLNRHSDAVAAAVTAAAHRRCLADLDPAQRTSLIDGLLAAAHFAYSGDLATTLTLTDEARTVSDAIADPVRAAAALRYRVLAYTAANRSADAATAAAELGAWWHQAATTSPALSADAADGLIFAAQYARPTNPAAALQLAADARDHAGRSTDQLRRLDLTAQAWEQSAWAHHDSGDPAAAADAAAQRLPLTEGLAALRPELSGQHGRALALHATLAAPVDPAAARASATAAITVFRRLITNGATGHTADLAAMENLLTTL